MPSAFPIADIALTRLSSPFVDPRKNVVSENKLLNPESRDFIARLARDCQEGNVNDIGAPPFSAIIASARLTHC